MKAYRETDTFDTFFDLHGIIIGIATQDWVSHLTEMILTIGYPLINTLVE